MWAQNYLPVGNRIISYTAHFSQVRHNLCFPYGSSLWFTIWFQIFFAQNKQTIGQVGYAKLSITNSIILLENDADAGGNI